MRSSQASSDDFPRLVRADNFDVWKTRVCAALGGKHLLGYEKKPNYDGISDEESEESRSDMSDVDDEPKSKPAEDAQVDSDTVDYDESDDEDLKLPSGSDDEDSDDSSDSSVKCKNLPTIRPINQGKLQKERLRGAKKKPQPLSPR
ncbi:hypothetical protein PI124_g16984 [Phytophthora idaei]|nr:hypothetical protein PI125_g17401 [Phytophthora idaei]KAG3140791.1 hypothetical protein PI126_g15820 [Phytophthora idaei]KAG3238042.1 hypothetical protein PI124_g16984 [Phytophthora idaei]